MPQAIAYSIRQRIVRRYKKGESLPKIANSLKLSYWTCRDIWRNYRDRGEEGLNLHYDRCGSKGLRSNKLIYRAALWLRYLHREWGAGYIRVHLLDRYGPGRVPSKRTLSRWFQQAGLTRPRSKRPSVERSSAKSVHEIWQVDAKEKVPLANGHQVSWLTFIDEKSGAILNAEFFSNGVWNQIPLEEIREAFRRVFQRWGLPQSLRFDNGYPWGCPSDTPTDFALWLIGLGIQIIWNHPNCPQENGKVERAQGTTKRWTESTRYNDPLMAKKRLEIAVEVQRTKYPYRKGKSRSEIFPELNQGAKPYYSQKENRIWQVQRVYQFLSQFLWTRKVNKIGIISMYHRKYTASRAYRGQHLQIRFDPDAVQWVILDFSGNEVTRKDAIGMTQNEIMAFQVSKKNNKSINAG